MDYSENTEWISAKLTPAQMEKVTELAAQAKTSRSAILRFLIDHATIETVTSIRFTQPEEAPQ